jgi:RecB family endonuclease NucS
MANLLLACRDGGRVGKHWAAKFIKRQPELKTHFNRTYDVQRALCEDPELIGAWFKLVYNMRAKYCIQDCDFYNFDETGFMMGVICASMVVTHADRLG